MRPKQTCALACMALGLTLTGCQPKTAPQSAPTVFRLFDLFRPEDLTGQVTLENADWGRAEWRPQDMAAWDPSSSTNASGPLGAGSPAVRYRAMRDIANLRVEQGKLTGDLTGPSPVLDLAFSQNRGGAESVKVVEVRMSVAGAKQAWMARQGGATIEDQDVAAWTSRTEPWKTAVELGEGKVQVYRFTNDVAMAVPRATNAPPASAGSPPSPAPGGARDNNPARADLRHCLLAFRDGKTGSFTIESVRFLTEKEEKLKEASGQQWAGLGEIYRACLAAKTAEAIRVPLRELPAGARLDFAIGTSEDAPVKFKVAAAGGEGANDAGPRVLFERTVTIPNRWQTARLDLSGYAGKSVVLEFTLSGEKKGLWGYWGAPVVRGRPVQPSAQAKRKPRGVIFLVIDTLRKDHLNIYGYPRETLVHLKKFAEEGVAFRHAISQATMTKISVPSMVTSLYPMSHTVLGFDKGLPASAKTIAEVFHEEGYATVAYSSVPFTGKMNNMHQGYDELHERGSLSDDEYRAKTARHYVDRAITWLEEHREDPFFMFLHVFDPHSPFRPRPPYDTLWGAPGAKERLAELEADMKKHKISTSLDNLPPKAEYEKTGNDPEELLKIYKDWYDGAIRGMDADIGRLLEALRELGLDQDTLVVWSTDHGEEFWEHGRLFHGHSVYGELNQVPMAYRWPNSPDIRKGVMVDQQVQNIDIMPTILELAGLRGPSGMQGRSLVPLLNGSGAANWQEQPAITQAMVSKNIDPRPPAMGGPAEPNVEKPHFGIIDRGWKLVRKEIEAEPQQELYEHTADSLNLTNVIKADGVASRTKALGDALEAWKKTAKAAELPNDDTVAQQVSSEELRRLRALGYVGGAAPPKPATNAMANTNAAPAPTNAPAPSDPAPAPH